MLFTDTILTIYILVLTGILGAVFGSFINCMAYRIAHKESVLHGRSHCPDCGHVLGAADLVPVFSFLFLKGRCRYCGKKISPRYMATELLMAGVFLGTVIRYDVSFLSLRILVLACILLAISLVDLETYEIPNGLVLAGVIWWLVTIPLMGGNWLNQLEVGLIGGFGIGAGMLLISLLFDKVTGKESLGGGDVKLFFMTGLYLGIAVALFNLILACLMGLILVVILRKDRIPFGPAIGAATWVSLLCGAYLVELYLSLF